MSQVVRFTEKILIHHRGANPSWRINTRSIMRRKALMMDAVPSNNRKSCREPGQARFRALRLTWHLSLGCERTCWLLCNK